MIFPSLSRLSSQTMWNKLEPFHIFYEDWILTHIPTLSVNTCTNRCVKLLVKVNESQNPCLRGRFIYVYRTGGRCDCPSAMGNSLLGIFSPMGMYMGRLLWDFHTWRAIAKWESKFELMEETSNVWSTVSLSWPTPYRRWRFSLSVCECHDCFFFLFISYVS